MESGQPDLCSHRSRSARTDSWLQVCLLLMYNTCVLMPHPRHVCVVVLVELCVSRNLGQQGFCAWEHSSCRQEAYVAQCECRVVGLCVQVQCRTSYSMSGMRAYLRVALVVLVCLLALNLPLTSAGEYRAADRVVQTTGEACSHTQQVHLGQPCSGSSEWLLFPATNSAAYSSRHYRQQFWRTGHHLNPVPASIAHTTPEAPGR